MSCQSHAEASHMVLQYQECLLHACTHRGVHSESIKHLASFPDQHGRYGYMQWHQVGRGKTHRGCWLTEILEAFLVLLVQGLGTRALSISRLHQYCLLFTMPETIQCETGIITVGHRPLCVYPLSTWCHCTWPDLPGIPSPYLHTVSNQRLEVEQPGNELINIISYLLLRTLWAFFTWIYT